MTLMGKNNQVSRNCGTGIAKQIMDQKQSYVEYDLTDRKPRSDSTYFCSILYRP